MPNSFLEIHLLLSPTPKTMGNIRSICCQCQFNLCWAIGSRSPAPCKSGPRPVGTSSSSKCLGTSRKHHTRSCGGGAGAVILQDYSNFNGACTFINPRSKSSWRRQGSSLFKCSRVQKQLKKIRCFLATDQSSSSSILGADRDQTAPYS